MPQTGGKPKVSKAPKKTSSSSTKRHFTVVIGSKEHGLYVSSSPSSAARKAVSKLCASNKSKKVEFSIREITQGSKKKTYGPYKGYIEKLKEPIELKGRVIKYKPVAKLSGKTGAKKGGEGSGPNGEYTFNDLSEENSKIVVNNNSVIISKRIRKKKAGFERKQNAIRKVINQEKLSSELARKKKLNEEEEAIQTKLRKEKNTQISRLYDILLKRVIEFYKSSKLTYYELIQESRTNCIILKSKLHSFNSIFLTINRKTLEYCAFRITKNIRANIRASILFTSNNIDEIIHKLERVFTHHNKNTLQELEINNNFYESFGDDIRNNIEKMRPRPC
jgi:hypothetical protein